MKKKPAEQNKEHLSNLLERYKKRLRPPQASVEKVVLETIEKVAGFTLEPNQLEYTVATKTIHLRVPSLLKTELKAKQADIKKELQKTLPDSDLPELFI